MNEMGIVCSSRRVVKGYYSYKLSRPCKKNSLVADIKNPQLHFVLRECQFGLLATLYEYVLAAFNRAQRPQQGANTEPASSQLNPSRTARDWGSYGIARWLENGACRSSTTPA